MSDSNRRPQTINNKMDKTFQCDICGRNFRSKRSLSSHRLHHNPCYHQKSLSGAAKGRLNCLEPMRVAVRKKRYERWKIKTENGCKVCGKQLTFPETQYCSEECKQRYRSIANSRSHSEETKNAISKGVLKHLSDTNAPMYEHVCRICGNEFSNYSKSKKNVFCSEQCRIANRSIVKPKRKFSLETRRKISNAIKKAFAEGRHMGNKYRCRAHKSYMESTFSEYISHNFKVFVEQEKHVTVTLNNKVKNYFIDFFLPQQKVAIELDGTQHKLTVAEDALRDQLLLNQLGIQTIRVTCREYRNKSKQPEIDSLLLLEQELGAHSQSRTEVN